MKKFLFTAAAIFLLIAPIQADPAPGTESPQLSIASVEPRLYRYNTAPYGLYLTLRTTEDQCGNNKSVTYIVDTQQTWDVQLADAKYMQAALLAAMSSGSNIRILWESGCTTRRIVSCGGSANCSLAP